MRKICLALDMGGTKIYAAVVDQAGIILHALTKPTQAALGGPQIVATMTACLDELKSLVDPAKDQIVGIGISAAGVIDTQSVSVKDAVAGLPGWKGTALGDIFSSRYHVPVWADNDVNCALLGEQWRNPLVSETQACVVMLTLGT